MKQNYTSEIKSYEWLEIVNVSSYELLELLLNTHVEILELEGRVSGKGNVLGVFPDGGSLHLLVDWQQAPEVVSSLNIPKESLNIPKIEIILIIFVMSLWWYYFLHVIRL